MKVNSVQKYNPNQNFKALRMQKGANKYILTMPQKALSKLDSVKEMLENTKFYHLDIGKDGFYITHINGDKLYQPYNIINAGKVLIIKGRQGLSQISKKLKYNSTNEIKLLISKIKNSSTQIERTTEIVKILDDYERKIQNENL